MASTGRTHAKYIQVFVDDSGGTLTELTAYVNNIGTVGPTYETQDVTAYSDGAKNIVIGQPSLPLTLSGPFDTVVHAHMIAIVGAVTPLSLDIRVGIRSAWDAGEPQFGITSSATSGYLCTSYAADLNSNTWTATFDVFGATAPAWGVAAET